MKNLEIKVKEDIIEDFISNTWIYIFGDWNNRYIFALITCDSLLVACNLLLCKRIKKVQRLFYFY